MIYYGIGHYQMRKCKDRLEKCFICAGPYKVENHYYEVAGCNKRKKKIYAHIILKYANYSRTYIKNFSFCALKYQADIKARKKKKTKEKEKEKEKEKMQVENISNEVEEERRKLNLQLDIEMEIKKDQTLSPESKEVGYEKEENQNEISKKKDHTKDFQY